MLVSVHMPKTGGTAFRRNVLEPAFGERLLPDYEDRPLITPENERNESAKAFCPDDRLFARYDCVHGHFLAVKYRATGCKFAAWFRDPVQRAVSRFHFGTRTAGGPIGPHTTLDEFCELEHLQNMYAKLLWSFDLDWLDFVGITEDYAAGVEMFCRMFDVPDPAGGAKAMHNANPRKETSLPYLVDSPLRKRIVQANQQDMDIYRRALARNRQMRQKWL